MKSLKPNIIFWVGTVTTGVFVVWSSRLIAVIIPYFIAISL